MAKIKYTKNELKRQKDNLKRFTRYLPTLELKKQQLLVEIRTIQNAVEQLEADVRGVEQDVANWAGVFLSGHGCGLLLLLRLVRLCFCGLRIT